MLLCRFSQVEGCSQNALCRIMQRSAVCVSTWAICCRSKVKSFQSSRPDLSPCRTTGFMTAHLSTGNRIFPESNRSSPHPLSDGPGRLSYGQHFRRGPITQERSLKQSEVHSLL
ncbi:hypothetical protein AVEN_5449-1 [Araneus ventricosus]|uniref:Uncharacterized protein n=1 Tax=Araneus ventricosus TaxID=182803 RepID=A0A4Y2DZD2_ARAVE|nr:hypothetical protein AVEN_5449-1 [Araneus ventricosus]